MKYFLILFLLVGLVSGGCVSKIDSGGAYQSDAILFNAENNIVNTYKIFDSFVTFEYNNRVALSSTPQVKQFADHLRVNAPKWKHSFQTLDAVYKTNPSVENRKQLVEVLTLIQVALTETATYFSTATLK